MAKKSGHSEIFGTDEDIELSDELSEKVIPHFPINPYLSRMADMVKDVNGLQELYAIHNSNEYTAVDNGVYIAMNKVNSGDYEENRLFLQWYERNLKINSNLRNICENNDTVLVLIGS